MAEGARHRARPRCPSPPCTTPQPVLSAGGRRDSPATPARKKPVSLLSSHGFSLLREDFRGSGHKEFPKKLAGCGETRGGLGAGVQAGEGRQEAANGPVWLAWHESPPGRHG